MRYANRFHYNEKQWTLNTNEQFPRRDKNHPFDFEILTPAKHKRPIEGSPGRKLSHSGPLQRTICLSSTQQNVSLTAVDQVWLVNKSIYPLTWKQNKKVGVDVLFLNVYVCEDLQMIIFAPCNTYFVISTGVFWIDFCILVRAWHFRPYSYVKRRASGSR